jgi:hypothetical protein
MLLGVAALAFLGVFLGPWGRIPLFGSPRTVRVDELRWTPIFFNGVLLLLPARHIPVAWWTVAAAVFFLAIGAWQFTRRRLLAIRPDGLYVRDGSWITITPAAPARPITIGVTYALTAHLDRFITTWRTTAEPAAAGRTDHTPQPPVDPSPTVSSTSTA